MANPNLRSPTVIREYSYSLILPNADTFENILGNAAGSGYLIKFDLWLWSRDGTGDWKAAVEMYSGAGTPICNQTGITATTTSTDALGTTPVGGPPNLPIPAALGQQVIRRFPLNEGYSVAVKPVGGSSANKVALWLCFSVLTDL
jgi:hypothetical protein